MMFKVKLHRQSVYLSDHVIIDEPSRNLRSSGTNLLLNPATDKKTAATAFTAAAPRMWNCLLPPQIRSPNTIGSFKALLKMHLFHIAYD